MLNMSRANQYPQTIHPRLNQVLAATHALETSLDALADVPAGPARDRWSQDIRTQLGAILDTLREVENGLR